MGASIRIMDPITSSTRCGVPFPMVMGDGFVVRCERDVDHAGEHRGAIIDLSDPFEWPDIVHWMTD